MGKLSHLALGFYFKSIQFKQLFDLMNVFIILFNLSTTYLKIEIMLQDIYQILSDAFMCDILIGLLLLMIYIV